MFCICLRLASASKQWAVILNLFSTHLTQILLLWPFHLHLGFSAKRLWGTKQEQNGISQQLHGREISTPPPESPRAGHSLWFQRHHHHQVACSRSSGWGLLPMTDFYDLRLLTGCEFPPPGACYGRKEIASVRKWRKLSILWIAMVWAP